MNFRNHDLPASGTSGKVRYETVPLQGPDGLPVSGLHSIWITLDNPEQLNSYTTEMTKDVILAFRRASNDRSAVAVVFTGAGNRAFCTGGNTAEYATYYAGRPAEYLQYMRLFNDMVTSILTCDLPVINRVNGLRIAGGQEIGMACDFSISSDLATFGQAGPKHGSAPDGGSTDFLPLFVGIEPAMGSCTLCEPWTAYKALRLGLLTEVVPVLEVQGKVVPNPLVVTDTWMESPGRIVLGELRTGEALERGKKLLKEGHISLEHLDQAVATLILKLARTMPGCLSKTLSSVRKHKLEHWDKNKETNRAWLALNMMTEGKAGFRAFHEAVGPDREVDFVKLRQALAAGQVWSDDLIETVLPAARRELEVT